ncbi:protein 5NUC-like isoform X2 [Daktulosphaira vitifoliae]|uniref:protein 5NUC-like isoform X2 n=1 Tax=Daktulosphaira vitifoliae TaxID=58002 RepID=UPI0021AAF2CF|nr:protein 5NUC-like isoform X2 [Daktulosphaira vitifoliae]
MFKVTSTRSYDPRCCYGSSVTMIGNVVWSLVAILAASLANVDNRRPTLFRLTVLHANDIHSRYEETGQAPDKCFRVNDELCKGYGGIGRMQWVLDRERARVAAEGPQSGVLFLYAGDTFQGSDFYDIMRWEPAADFLGDLGIDAMCLGNHEFEDGPEGLVPFLNSVNISTIPVVVTNLNLTDVPSLAKVKSYAVLNIAGHTIGIVGYLTPDTTFLNKVGKVKILDEIESLKPVVTELKEQGIDFVIAIGHSGLEMDKRVAREVEGVDAIVGGHSHSYLFSGLAQDSETSMGPYPVIEHRGDRIIPVVQAYAFTKYLGKMVLSFKNGKLVNATGEPILLDDSIPQDARIMKKVDYYKKLIVQKHSDIQVGSTRVLLDGEGCKCAECNLGNAIADAFIRWNVDQLINDKLNNFGWTDASVSIILSSAIRASINTGGVFQSNISSALPYNTYLNKVTVTGSTLVKALEHSASLLDKPKCAIPEKNIYGAYMQVSGLRVTYDRNKPQGSRILSAFIRCAECRIPLYESIQPDRQYKVIITKYMANGGDQFTMIRDEKIDSVDLNKLQNQHLLKYICTV